MNDVDEVMPETYNLALNVSPNPFNRSASIDFTINKPGRVDLSAIDISGRSAKTFAQRSYRQGSHRIAWNAEGLAAGIYFVVLKSNNTTQVVKVLCLK